MMNKTKKKKKKVGLVVGDSVGWWFEREEMGSLEKIVYSFIVIG